MAIDLASGRVNRRPQHRDVLGLLAEHDFANDCLDVVVGELDGEWEAVDELLQGRRGRERALPRGYEQHLALEPRGAALDDVLHAEGLVVVVAYVLLHLVEHDEGERELACSCRLEP